MSDELTTADVAERLDRPERTIRLWCKQGLFSGARAVDTPRGSYWLIPASALKGFQEPPRGRPAKPKPLEADKPAPAKKRAAGGHSRGKK